MSIFYDHWMTQSEQQQSSTTQGTSIAQPQHVNQNARSTKKKKTSDQLAQVLRQQKAGA